MSRTNTSRPNSVNPFIPWKNVRLSPYFTVKFLLSFIVTFICSKPCYAYWLTFLATECLCICIVHQQSSGLKNTNNTIDQHGNRCVALYFSTEFHAVNLIEKTAISCFVVENKLNARLLFPILFHILFLFIYIISSYKHTNKHKRKHRQFHNIECKISFFLFVDNNL